MSVRAKFKCNVIVENLDKLDDGKTIQLDVVVDDSAENKSFFRWTPSGQVKMWYVNVEANKQFLVGQEYYVDFTPVLQPHQIRVVEEKFELDQRIDQTRSFYNSPTYDALSVTEKALLTEQLALMSDYSTVLQSRISNFGKI